MDLISSFKNRIRKNFIENKVLFIVFLILWIVAIIVTLNLYKTTIGKESIGKQNCEKVIELDEKVTITQSMTSIDQAESIAVKFATYARKNSGTIFVKVIGNQSKTIYLDSSISTSLIQDNAFATFHLNEQINKKKDNSVTLVLTSNSKENLGIGVYYGSEKEFGSYDEDSQEERFSLLTINGVVVEDEIGFKYLINNEDLMKFSKTVIVLSIFGYTMLVFLLLLVQPKYEFLFAIVILVFGLIFMAVIVPLSPPDEQYHYEASLQVSNYILGEENHIEINKRYSDYSHFYGHYNVSGGYIRFLEDINIPLDLSIKTYKMSEDVDNVYSVCFIPQAFGITIARLLGVNMLRTFYAGRLFNLIFYIVCIFIAIKNTPIHKLLFGILASLPLFIQTAASYSYDCYIIALCFIIASFLFKWKYVNETIKIKEYILVLICCIGLAPLKYVYGFLPLLYFFVPKSRFKNNIWYKIIAIMILIIPGMSYLMPMILERVINNISKLFESTSEVTVINEARNLISTDESFGITEEEIVFDASYMFSHPIETATIFLRTIRYSIKQWFYNSLGRALSGETLVLPSYLFKSIAIITILSAFRKEQFIPSIPFRLGSVGVCIIIGLLIMVGMFLSWTESTQEIVENFGGVMVSGVQGRYFSPLLPFFFMIFNNKKISLPEKTDKLFILSLILITFEVLMYILSYTFVN